MCHVAVIDIGKTNAKVVLVDMDTMGEIAIARRSNQVLAGPPYPHYDAEGLWLFMLDALKHFQTDHGVDAITVTTHGASAVLLDDTGALAAPILDYEFDGPDMMAADYDAIRPDFTETGSPRLPIGLNIGAQLFWQFASDPTLQARVATILTYPQYWSWRLSGIATNEVTSLGCHTDLWIPGENRFSSMVEKQGWHTKMAPIASADTCLGAILPEIAATTGMSPKTPVFCGIHDSNASLYAHLAVRQAPFAVVSTGTWVISMAIGAETKMLDPARDTLINVNAHGAPVPSARFMGGREFERLMGNRPAHCSAADIASTIARSAMLLPAVEPQSGPFQGRQHGWRVDENQLNDGERFAAISFYLALMTATGLTMTGAKGPIIVEGPFADNQTYLDMLASATARPVEAVAGTGTSIGASLLISAERAPAPIDNLRKGVASPALANYAKDWIAQVEA